ncbi:interleukin-17 receptor D [Pholidichthys leucotaenia]
MDMLAGLGRPECEYCRISSGDIRKALGFNPIPAFGSCVPWPCLELLGEEDNEICQHYVHAPRDVKVDFVNETDNQSDTVVVSWRPSDYGIAFLRGFQVSLQALGGSGTACQLFLFHRNVSLQAPQDQRVYRSDPFPGLTLGSQYAVTVMALPVPEEWERFYSSEIFSTRSCAEKNGLQRCKKDWYPEHVKVQRNGTAVAIIFNLAPPDLGITSYFSQCYANGMKKYTDITPDLSRNKTHHKFELGDLQEGENYICEIAANEVDAVRKVFSVQVPHVQKEEPSHPSASPLLAVVVPMCLAIVLVPAVWFIAHRRKKSKLHTKKLKNLKPDIVKQHEENATQEEVMSLSSNRLIPPRLLICYSSRDGPAHVKAVLQLGAFIQQHMATQVNLDLWDSLGVAKEGSMAWHYRHICQSDFVLVICSQGLSPRLTEPQQGAGDQDEEEEDLGTRAVIGLIGEEVCQAKARGLDLSKYMAAVFEYSEDTDVPAELRLVSRYSLTKDLPMLFSHLHGVSLHQPGSYLKIDRVSEEGFTKVPAGAALQWAIHEAWMAARAKKTSGTIVMSQ